MTMLDGSGLKKTLSARRATRIFTLHAIRAAFALPWRNHFWHGSIVAVGAVIFALAYRAMPSEHNDRYTRRNLDNLNETQVLLLGNSVIYSLDEARFALPTRNFAVKGSGYRTQYAILRNLLPRMKSIRMVILNFDNLPLRIADTEERAGDLRDFAAAGLPWYKIPVPFRERFRFAVRYSPPLRGIFTGSRIVTIDRFSNVWRGLTQIHGSRQSPARSDAKPSRQTSTAATKPAPVSQAVTHHTDISELPPPRSKALSGRYQLHHYMDTYNNETVRRANTTAFLGIVEACNSRHVPLILLRTPTVPAFSGNRTNEWDKELVDLLDRARTAYPKLPLFLWDFERRPEFPVERFVDSVHLDGQGLRDEVRLLNERINDSPFRDDSATLFGYRRDNLLTTYDPREEPWGGLASKDSAVVRAKVPPQLQNAKPNAFRISLHPGEALYTITRTPVHAGDTFEFTVWLWSEQAETNTKLVVLLVRDGPGKFTGQSRTLDRLSENPEQVAIEFKFMAPFNGARVRFLNRGDKDLNFCMADPIVRLKPVDALGVDSRRAE